jgi:acyl transferase domain-containing protein
MPIAIIDLGERFPEDASNPDKLWDLIFNDRSALTKMPKNRFRVDVFYHPHHERLATINIRETHFMKDDVFAFDASFFSSTPNEAKVMDLQQMMTLECTYEALKNDKIYLIQRIQCFNSSK